MLNRVLIKLPFDQCFSDDARLYNENRIWTKTIRDVGLVALKSNILSVRGNRKSRAARTR